MKNNLWKIVSAITAKEGSVTVVMAGIAVGIVVLTTTLLGYVKLELSFTHAQNNADVAAISAAKSYYYGKLDPCVVAEKVANANDGKLLACRIEENGIEVQVQQGILTKAKAKATMVAE